MTDTPETRERTPAAERLRGIANDPHSTPRISTSLILLKDADLIDELSASLGDCLRYIEADERAHNTTFAAGRSARAVLARARGETPR